MRPPRMAFTRLLPSLPSVLDISSLPDAMTRLLTTLLRSHHASFDLTDNGAPSTPSTSTIGKLEQRQLPLALMSPRRWARLARRFAWRFEFHRRMVNVILLRQPQLDLLL